MPLNNVDLRAQILGSYVKSRDLSTLSYPFSVGGRQSLTSGTAADQCDLMFDDQRTILASGTDSLDLRGVLTDAFGDTLNFVTVKAILVKAAEGNVNNVVVGGAESATFVGPFSDASDKISVKPGGWLYLFAPNTGWSVGAGTSDTLLIANSSSGSSVVYDIIILGTSA